MLLLLALFACSKETRLLRHVEIDPVPVVMTATESQRDDGRWQAFGTATVDIEFQGNRTWTISSDKPGWMDPRVCPDDVPLFWIGACGSGGDCSYPDGGFELTIHDDVWSPTITGTGCMADSMAGTYDGDWELTATVCRGDQERCDDGQSVELFIPISFTVE